MAREKNGIGHVEELNRMARKAPGGVHASSRKLDGERVSERERETSSVRQFEK
jgi:hypothetical protein